MKTPDTEWERDFGEQLEMRGITGYVKQSIIEDVRRQRSSRDTYWKERVQNEQQKYNELLLAVGNKYEGETRHQTALRYIQNAEIANDSVAKLSNNKEEMAHDQQIFTDGFSHPTDCEECKKKV